MPRPLRYVLALAVASLAAVFAVLPRTGADRSIQIVASGRSFAFRPVSAGIDPGQRVAFVNDSTATHTATCTGCPWDTRDIQPGETVFLSFIDEGDFAFACRYHGATGMAGRLRVGTPPSPSPTATPSPAPGAPGGTPVPGTVPGSP